MAKVSKARRAQVTDWRRRNRNFIKAAKNAGVTLTTYRRRLARAARAVK
jgi:hypothetical protein